MGKLRRRLDGLEAHAHQTMTGADAVLLAIKDLVADLADGIKIQAEVTWQGRTFVVPAVLKIDPREDE